MFFYVVGTHTKCIINDFSPAPKTNIWISKCHTVTHGTDLRKSPPWSVHNLTQYLMLLCFSVSGEFLFLNCHLLFKPFKVSTQSVSQTSPLPASILDCSIKLPSRVGKLCCIKTWTHLDEQKTVEDLAEALASSLVV